MDDINIEIFEDENLVSNPNEISLPKNFISVGNINHEGIQVYIKQNVYKKIEKFAKEDMSKEVGSILVGEYCDGCEGKAVIISDYIEAKYTDASASTLTFTHETWNYIYEEKDKKYPDKKIVGWQHTHPGYGIFLSNYDTFIQENFFNLPWQIAYVVDPIANTRGFFEWKNGKISKMTGFYVYDEKGRKIILSEKTKPAKRLPSSMSLIFASLFSVLLVVSVVFGIEIGRLNGQLKKAKAELKAQPKTTQSVITEQAPEKNTELFRIHTVDKGETLAIICEKYSLDYKKYAEKIKRINSLEDADKIYVGQKIYLPIAD